MGIRTIASRRWPVLAPLLGKADGGSPQHDFHEREALRYPIGNRTQKADATWYRGEHCNFLPDRAALGESGALDSLVAAGWLPSEPFISRSDPITAFGSCFAQHISEYLMNAGYNIADKGRDRSSYVIRCGEGMVNTASIAQQFLWAYGEAEFNEPLWYEKSGKEAGYEEEVRAETRSIFERTNVFIITLGLSEVWYNKETGDVFWRAIPKSRFNPERHGFKVLSVQENRDNLSRIYGCIRKYRPEASIVFTLSPVPLVATFRPVSCITANSVSKASLRVAVDELMREHEDDPKLFYFPSYEIVKDVFVDPYKDDFRHIKPEVVSEIMQLFARNYLRDG